MSDYSDEHVTFRIYGTEYRLPKFKLKSGFDAYRYLHGGELTLLEKVFVCCWMVALRVSRPNMTHSKRVVAWVASILTGSNKTKQRVKNE